MARNHKRVGLEITQELVRSLFHYDADTGIFTRKVSAGGPNGEVGKVAGWVCKSGYMAVKVCGKEIKQHRLAWLYVYGYWPADLDHINQIKTDNRICNLRETDDAKNMQNVAIPNSHNKLGVRGVSRLKSGSYRAQIKTNNVVTHLGCFGTVEEAQAAYLAAKKAMHPYAAFVDGAAMKEQT